MKIFDFHFPAQKFKAANLLSKVIEGLDLGPYFTSPNATSTLSQRLSHFGAQPVYTQPS